MEAFLFAIMVGLIMIAYQIHSFEKRQAERIERLIIIIEQWVENCKQKS